MMKVSVLGVATLAMIVAALAVACGGGEPKQPPEQTARAAIQQAKETPVSTEISRYARRLCDPLSDFVREASSLQNIAGEDVSEEANLGQALAAIRQLKQPLRDLVDAMRDIQDVPAAAQPWHRGTVATLEYVDGLISLVESGGLLAALAAGPTPEPAPEPPDELGAAIISECGEDLLALLEELEEETPEGVEVPTEISSPTAKGTPVPRGTATPKPIGTSRTHPVPRGQSLVTPAEFEITVIDVNFDAWPVVQAENMFNDPPRPGNVMVLVRVRATYVGSDGETASVSEGDFKLTGSLNRVYSPYDQESSCGLIPDQLQGELFTGGSVEGNVCFQVPASETRLILIAEPLFSFGENERRYFALE